MAKKKTSPRKPRSQVTEGDEQQPQKSSTNATMGTRARSKSERIRQNLKENPGHTRKEVAETFDASYGLVEKIVAELRGGKKPAKTAGKAKQRRDGDTGDNSVAAKAISFIEAAGGLQQSIDILQVVQKISVVF